MIATPLDIADVVLLEPVRHRDSRGFFSETYNAQTMASVGIHADFVQDNQSLTRAAGTVRGLHYQDTPHAQGKLIRVVRGAIYDVAVDLRPGSPTFGHYVGAKLSAANWRQLWIPIGFAHGFCTLEADTEIHYKVTGHYAPDADRGIRFDDPQIAIDWPYSADEIVLSEKDTGLPYLADIAPPFT